MVANRCPVPVKLNAVPQALPVAASVGVAHPLGAHHLDGGAHGGAGALNPLGSGGNLSEPGMGPDGLTYHHGGGALALYIQPAANGVFCILGPPGFHILRKGAGVRIGDTQAPPARFVAEAEQVTHNVIDMQLHAISGKGVIARYVLSAQQGGIERFERGGPALKLATKSAARALVGVHLLAGGLAVGGQNGDISHTITLAGPRRRELPAPCWTSSWLM